MNTLEFHSVDYHYPEQHINFFNDLNLSIFPGWTGVLRIRSQFLCEI